MIAGTLEIQLTTGIARLQKEMQQANQTIAGFGKQTEAVLAGVSRAFAALGLGVGLQQIAQIVDEYTKYTAQLKLATSSQADYNKALSDTRNIARAAQTDLAAVGVLYARIANGTRELGISQQRVADITEVVSLALKVSGATAQESSSAMLQLSQAFGSGALRGEEFNAVNEAAPRLMRALADGLGVPIGALRQMSQDGKITSQVMASVLPRALEDLRREAAQVQTIAGAFTLLKNSVMEFLGTQAQASGQVGVITGALSVLADNLRLVAAAIAGITALKLSQWLLGVTKGLFDKAAASMAASNAATAERAASVSAAQADVARAESTLAFVATDRAAMVQQLASANATITATRAIGAQSAALAANTTATAAASTATAELVALSKLQAAAAAELAKAEAALVAATTGAGAGLFARLLGFLGGPIGIVTTLLSLGATAWVLWGDKASAGEKAAQAAVGQSTPQITEDLQKQIDKLKERNAAAAALPTAGMFKDNSGLNAALKAMDDALNKMDQAGRGVGPFEGMNLEQRTASMRAFGEIAGQVFAQIQEFRSASEADALRTNATKLDDWLAKNKDFATTAQKLAAEIKKARADLGDAFSPQVEALITESVTKTIENTQKLAIAAASAQGSATKNYLDVENQLNEIGFKEGLQGLDAYYANRRTIIDKQLKAELRDIDAQKEAQNAILGRANVTPDEVLGAREKLLQLNVQGESALLQTGLKLTQVWHEQNNAVKEANNLWLKTWGDIEATAEDIEKQLIDMGAARNTAFSQDAQEAQFQLKLVGMERDALSTLGVSYSDLTAKTVQYHIAVQTETALRKLSNDEKQQQHQIDQLLISDAQKALEKDKLREDFDRRRAQIPEETSRALTAQAQLNDAKKVADAQQQIQVDMWRSLDDTARDTFRSIFDSGKGTFERLRDTLKNTLYDLLYQMTLRPFLIQVVTTAAGTDVARGAFGAAGTLATSGGGGSSGIGAGDVASSGVSLFSALNGTLADTMARSGAFVGNLFGGSQLAFQVGQFLPLALPAILQALTGNIKGAAVTGALTAAGFLLGGPIGGTLGGIIGSLGGSLFGGSKKIPAKLIDSGGLGFTGAGSQFFSRGSQGAMDVSSAVSKGIQEAAKGLAITLPSYGIGFGSNTGNQGQNPNFSISASVGTGTDYGNQRNVFASGEEMGQSNALDQATIALRSAQAMLAVLREGDMPKYLKDFFDSLKPIASMSADDVNAAIQAAGQLKSAYDLLAKIADLSNLSASADQLIELFGDVQTAVPLLQAYYTDFFTDAEKQAQALKQVDDAMVQLGVTTLPKTRAEFRALVEAQDLTTDAGKAMFQSLIAIAPAFAAVTDAIDATADAALSLQDQLSKAQSDAIDFIRDQISASRDAAKAAHDNADAYRAAGQSLQDAIRSLRQGSLSTLLPGQKLSEARNTLDSVFSAALSGDKGALSQLPTLAQDFLQASRDFNASSQAYSSDFARVMQMLEQAGVASGTFGGTMDSQATLLDIQTSTLQNILATLEAPTPELDALNAQLSILQAVQGLLGDATRNILTVNSSIVDQTGQVISGNSLISGQTGEIVSLPRLIASYDYTVQDPALRGVLSVTDPVVLAQAQALLSASGPLAQGQYAIQDATGRVYAATVDQTGVVAALNEITRGQAGTIALGNALLDAQTHQIILGNTTLDARTGELVQGIDEQTGKVIAGNSTSDAIRNLTARDTSVSEEMLVQLAQNSTTQSSQFASMVDGINRTVQSLNELIGLQQQLTAAEAARVAAEEAAAAKQAQIATQQAALSSAAAMQGSVIAEINAGIQGITDLKKTFGGYVEPINAQGQYATFEVKDGKFFSDFADVLYSSGRSDLAEQFKTQFFAPGGLYDQVFGKAAQLSSLTQQIDTLRDLISSLGGIPSHAAGLDYVPYDGYLAKLHRGEYIATASEGAAIRSGRTSYSGAGFDSAAICDELKQLREEVRTLREQGSRDVREQSRVLAGAFVEGSVKGAREQVSRTRNRDDAQRTKSR